MPVVEMRASTVGGVERVAGRHIMPVAVMVALAVSGTGGCKPVMEVGLAPLTSVNGLFRNSDFTR